MKLSHIAKLDIVLGILADDLSNGDGLNLPQILLKTPKEITLIDAQVILEKLIKDSYVITKSFHGLASAIPIQNTMHLITFEGLVFHESGAYTTKINLDKQNEKRAIRNEILLVRGTWFAGITGILLLLWQILLYFLPTHT